MREKSIIIDFLKIHKSGTNNAINCEEVQPRVHEVLTVLLGGLWVSPAHIDNCRVQLRHQIGHEMAAMDGQHCWRDYQCPPTFPRGPVLYQDKEKCRKNPIRALPPCSRARASRHFSRFFPTGHPPHEQLTILKGREIRNPWNTTI